MHISDMVKEIIDFWRSNQDRLADATLGYGGHTKAMLQCLQGTNMYATDVDHEEAVKTKKDLKILALGRIF